MSILILWSYQNWEEPVSPGSVEGASTGSSISIGDLVYGPVAVSGESTGSSASIGEIGQSYVETPFDTTVTWDVGLFTLDGTMIDWLQDIDGRTLTYRLLGVDQMTFTMSLDHRSAAEITPLETVVKVWRSNRQVIPDVSRPDFVGVIGPIDEDGPGNRATITAFSPLWRLGFRHLWQKFQARTDVGLVMQTLISTTNALGPTGIVNGIRESSLDQDIVFDARQNVLSAITDMASILGGPDFAVTYTHRDGQRTLCQFDVLKTRGSIRGESCTLHFNTGIRNVAGMTRSISVSEDRFATYLRGYGQSSADDWSVTAFDTSAIERWGLYEGILDQSNAQTVDGVQAYVDSEIVKRSRPMEVVQATLTPTAPPRYGTDVSVGDVVRLVGNKGRMVIDRDMRVHEAVLTNSANDVETLSLTLADRS